MKKKRILTFFILLLFLLQIVNFLTNNNSLLKADESNDFPSDLNVGDLFFCDVKPDIQKIADTYGLSQIESLTGYANDHIGMYIGGNKFIEATPYLYAPLRNEYIGVVITPYWFLKIWATNITFGYVKTDQKTRDAAVEWAKTQIGKPYGYEENDFTCAKLVFEAYKKQNLVINFTWPYNNKTYNASVPAMFMRSNQVVMYSNILPNADVSDSLGYNYVNDTIYFNAFNSSDLDGMIMKFIWDFGDGASEERYPSVGREVTHIYEKPDNYTISLTVIDNAGATDIDTTTILIKENELIDDDPDNDNPEPDQNTSDNSEGEYSVQEIIQDDADKGLSILIGTFFAIFLSVLLLVWIIKK